MFMIDPVRKFGDVPDFIPNIARCGCAGNPWTTYFAQGNKKKQLNRYRSLRKLAHHISRRNRFRTFKMNFGAFLKTMQSAGTAFQFSFRFDDA